MQSCSEFNGAADSQPLLTIVVIVYNVDEVLLRRCLTSLERHSDDGIDVLVIDDGSTDGCPDICDEFSARHDNWEVIHTANRGASCARNTGIENARGEWLTFVDGDDYILGGFIDRIPGIVAQHEDADIVYFGYRTSWDVNGAIDESDGSGEDLSVPEPFELARAIVANTEFLLPGGEEKIKYGSPWGKLISTRFLRETGHRFVPGVIKSQDRVFMTGLLSFNPRLAAVDAAGYAYVSNPNSITRRHDPNMDEKLAHTTEVMRETLLEHYQGEQLADLLAALENMRCVFMYNALDATYLCPNGNDRYHHEYAEFVSYVSGFADSIDACRVHDIYGVRNKYLIACLKRRLYRLAYYGSMLMMDMYLIARGRS